MTDKEKFIKLLDNIKIKYELKDLYRFVHNLEDIEEGVTLTELSICNSTIDDWDLDEYAGISIEFDKNDNFVQFKLKRGGY